MRKLLLLSLLLISSVEPSACIISSRNIRTVLNELQKHSSELRVLVAFDLDETLIEPNNDNHYGGDMWLQASVNNAVEKGTNVGAAWDLVLREYFKIQMDPDFSFKLVEGDETKQVVTAIQKLADKTIGLTARSFPIEDATIDRVEKVGISFVESGKFDALPTQEKVFMFHGVPGGFKHGIFFAGTGDKGESLMVLLETCDYQPDVVVFVDDKLKNLQAVEKFVEAAGMEFIGILYTRLDEAKKNYKLDPNLTVRF